MTKGWFMAHCNEVWVVAGLLDMPGHGFCIGGATHLLLITAGSIYTHMQCLVTDFDILALTCGVHIWVLFSNFSDEVCTFAHFK